MSWEKFAAAGAVVMLIAVVVVAIAEAAEEIRRRRNTRRLLQEYIARSRTHYENATEADIPPVESPEKDNTSCH